MVRVSNKARVNAGLLGKVVLTALFSSIAIVAVVLASYKPVYSVLINGEFKGYVSSKKQMQQDIEKYLQEGDSERVGYILLKNRPEYEFGLVRKDVDTKDEEILLGVKESCDVYYKVYAINVNDEDVCLVDTLADAQSIVDKVNDAQKDYTVKASVMISEKYEKEYEVIDDIELAVNSIIAPLEDQNEDVVKKVKLYAAQKSVPQAILDAIKSSNTELKFSLPLSSYVITSRYGWRRSGYHTGCDYAAPLGSPIYAIEAGVVTSAQWSGNYGYLVKILHAGGFETYYAHCSRFACNVGDKVEKGELIAYVGSTGNSTGPHCHLEIRYNGSTIDPETLASAQNSVPVSAKSIEKMLADSAKYDVKETAKEETKVEQQPITQADVLEVPQESESQNIVVPDEASGEQEVVEETTAPNIVEVSTPTTQVDETTTGDQEVEENNEENNEN